jgi:hypothetical protein
VTDLDVDCTGGTHLADEPAGIAGSDHLEVDRDVTGSERDEPRALLTPHRP